MNNEMGEVPVEISRETKKVVMLNGSSVEYEFVVFRQKEEGQHRLVHVLEYNGVSTEISPDEDLLDQHAETFIEMVDTGLFDV